MSETEGRTSTRTTWSVRLFPSKPGSGLDHGKPWGAPTTIEDEARSRLDHCRTRDPANAARWRAVRQVAVVTTTREDW